MAKTDSLLPRMTVFGPNNRHRCLYLLKFERKNTNSPGIAIAILPPSIYLTNLAIIYAQKPISLLACLVGCIQYKTCHTYTQTYIINNINSIRHKYKQTPKTHHIAT